VLIAVCGKPVAELYYTACCEIKIQL